MENISVIVIAIIGFITLFGIIGNMQARIKLTDWLKELSHIDSATVDAGRSSRWMNNAIEEYRNFHLSGVANVNSPVLVEKHLMKEPIRVLGIFKVPTGNIIRLIHGLPSLAIIVGVLGTFVGLTIAIMAMQDTLVGIGNQPGGANLSVSSIVTAISEPFRGMSIAFVTSIAGIGSSLLLSLVQSGFLTGGTSLSYLQDRVISEAEGVLDHVVQEKLQNEKPKDSLERLLDRLVSKVQESFQESIGDFSEKMIGFTSGLEDAMNDVKGILSAQRDHTEQFKQSSDVLVMFGDRFSDTITKLESVQHSVDKGLTKLGDHVSGFEKQYKRTSEQLEQGQKRMEHVMKHSDRMIEDSQKKTEELGRSLVGGVETVLSRYETKQEDFERRMAQQNDEWFHRYQDKTEQYGRANDTFAGSVQHLEKAWYSTIETFKRDFIDQLGYMFERERQSRQEPGKDQEMRELIRALDSVYQNLSREFKQTHQYFGDVYHVLQRLLDATVQSANARHDRDPYDQPRRITIQDQNHR
ncbi:hypothetical protein [Pseudalkalibacillus berkeleyi]|uniref:MotA/TolQ/ExbB proton channel domain-containing protein n=1 Tax=Pseudalkalibacillus berkeleyi TaxID=1069813 RepID=A0ABS9H4X3_9BACL|nr:hypothetical protein [Pseudalkalibacillus berkeleyi]MCF6138860.1 hypothetical protein [Pseudalkalibacillus berkeleyi]